MTNFIKYFNRLETRLRGKLSHYPVVYAVVGGVGIILFWRGVWHGADDFNLSSLASTVIGAIILLVTGVFVSAFIGNRLIISGLIGEKRLSEKQEVGIQTEETQLHSLQDTLTRLEKKLDHIDQDLENKKKL